MTTMRIVVNGRSVEADVEPTTLLVELLRGPLALTGTHVGCDTAQCGACTVLLDGQPVKSCSMLALQAQGRSVRTVESLARENGELHPLQEAFMACHGLQCGFCTPGMLMASAGLRARNTQPGDAEVVPAVDGKRCRGPGCGHIVVAVREGSRVMAGNAEGHRRGRSRDPRQAAPA